MRCLTEGFAALQLMVNRSQQAREVLSSERLRNVTAGSGRFNTTEVHCNEFFPNSTTATLTTVFSSSAYLATLLLEIWYMLLGPSHRPVSLCFAGACQAVIIRAVDIKFRRYMVCLKY